MSGAIGVYSLKFNKLWHYIWLYNCIMLKHNLFLAFLLIGVTAFAQKNFTIPPDAFGTRAFIENKGQYNASAKSEEKIRFAYETSNEHIYFTDKGLVYKMIRKFPVSKKQHERMEHGKKLKLKPDEIHYVNMNWIGSNEHISIVESEKQSYYFTYGGAERSSCAFKKITYKNVYDNIDIEYSIPQDKEYGIKYNVILHPGANASDIRIAYSGEVQDIFLKNGQVEIETPLEKITEHVPYSFYENGQKLESKFSLEDKIISFELPGNYDHSKKIIVDPWVTTLTNMLSNNYAYDVDYDNNGNLFIYGGLSFMKVAKYSPVGTLLWTFSGDLNPNAPWDTDIYGGNFLVHKTTGKIYIGQGYSGSGTQIVRLDGNGNYDNFITTIDPQWNELWDMGFHCPSGKVYGLGGGGSSNVNGGLIDQITGTVLASNFSGVPDPFQDIASNAIDDAGNIFVYYAGTYVYNTILRVNISFNGNVWSVPSTYTTLDELSNKDNYVGANFSYFSNGFNCLAVNNNYLYFYDGYNLAAYDKNTGTKVGFTTIPVYTALQQGGIAVDDCDNVYVGGISNVKCYHFNGSNFNFLQDIPLNVVTPNQYVYDIKYEKCTKLIYVCGSGFAGVYNAAVSNTCTSLTLGCMQAGMPASAITVTQTSCSSSLNIVSLNVPSSPQPTITWSPAPQSLSGNSLTATGLTPGICTVSVVYGNGCPMIGTVNILPPPPPVSFSVNNLSGTNILTCSVTAINFTTATNYTFGTLNYFWSSLSFTANTSSVSISQPGNVTVTATDPATGCSATLAIAIGINTIAPTNTVTPPSQAITCASGAITFTGTTNNPSVNVQHDWYSPVNPLPFGVPIASATGTITLVTGSLSPGVYTLQTTNLVNGCKTLKTVTVTSLDAWPTFSIASTTGFSIGCNPLHQTTLSIINPVSTQTPPATTSYTFLPPGFSGVVSPSVILDPNNTSTVTQTPGNWTVIVQDNSSFCRTQITIPILQNTVAPNVSANVIPFSYTLMCKTPTLLAIGNSTTANTIVSWQVPSVPPFLASNTVAIGDILNGPNTGSTSLFYANFTVVANNTLNACKTTSVIPIYQNFKAPISGPTISIATPTAIYCTSVANPVVLTTGNSTVTSGGFAAFVANPCWDGPSPQVPICGPSTYSCYVPGIYSLTVEDSYNGCKHTGTVNVLDKTQPPVITNSLASVILDCGSQFARLVVNIAGASNGLRYWYFDFPVNSAFSPSNAIIANGPNIFLSGTSSATVDVSLNGNYQYMVINTLTGCQAFGVFRVNQGNLSADFSPDPISGYSPLSVVFTPTNYSGLNGVTNVWSFGNGISQTNTTNISPTTIYDSPGTYTAVLISKKGDCVDTTYKIIRVELPSKLETPNIFTPNGDGSNDVFFLKTANLGEIDALIFDRWGNKVYEVKSATGNIAWDGKNMQGKECAAGVYLYLISAKGNDSKEYKVKGNVTLMR
jgi:gliding motility-associated-like protein